MNHVNPLISIPITFFRVTRHENGSQVCFTHFAAELAPSFPHSTDSTDSTNPYRPKMSAKKVEVPERDALTHLWRQLCVSLEFLRKCYGFENTGWYSGDMHEKTPHSHIGINSVLPNSEQNPYNSTITCRDQKGLLTHTALGAIWSKYEEFNGWNLKRKYLVRLRSLNDKKIIWTYHNHWPSGSLENSASKLMHKSEALQKKNAKRNFELWWNVASLRRYGGEFELWKLPTSKHHTVTQCLIASCEGCDHFTRSTLARKWWELYFKLVPFSQKLLKIYYVDCVDRFIDQSTCLSLSAMISYMTSYDIQGFASHLAPESLSSSRKSLPETGAVFRLCWTLLFTRCYVLPRHLYWSMQLMSKQILHISNVKLLRLDGNACAYMCIHVILHVPNFTPRPAGNIPTNCPMVAFWAKWFCSKNFSSQGLSMSTQGPGISGKLVQTSSASRDSFTSGFSGGFGGFSAAIRSSSITLFRTETTWESVNANKNNSPGVARL